MRIVRLRVILVATVVGLAALAHAPAAFAACAANTANLGQVTGNFTISTAGTYRVWSRISVPDTTGAYTLEIDDAAPNCNITVGGNVTSLNTWTWVDYQSGTTTNKINMTLTAGQHSYKMYGKVANVKVDRIIFSQSCLTTAPSGTGDSCLAPPPDTQAPTPPTSLTSPAKTSNSVTLAWNAGSDNVAVTGYKVYRGGTLIKTLTSPVLTYTDTGLTAATNYSYQVSALDAANLESTKSTALSVNTDVGTPPPDTTPPSVPTGLTSTGKSSTNIALSWGASTDNSGTVTGYKLYRNGTLWVTLPASTRTFNDTSVVAGTTYSYQVSAFDAVPNESAKSSPALSVTTDSPVTVKPGDFAPPGAPDNVIDFKDMLALLSHYNSTDLTYDLTGDHVVDFKDMLNLLSKYGK